MMNAISRRATALGCSCLVGVLVTDACAGAVGKKADAGRKPNIVFIMSDDLGYAELGCYGQEILKTPHIDRLAEQGLRFTDCYAGSTVCAPSRCVLMTGLHTGHCLIRGNARVPLRPEDITVAEALHKAGYVTGMFGKWGLGEPATSGIPNAQGFDEWFGYLNQGHAHNYYPEFLWKNQEKYPLPNQASGGVATKAVTYSNDVILRECLDFLDRRRDDPFFLYVPFTLPHVNNERTRATGDGMEVPGYGRYADKDWPTPEKGRAQMITMLDDSVGRILAKLDELGLADDTIVFFTNDNGAQQEGGSSVRFFESNGPLRGIKRDLYEGGIRVPMIVRWPGKTPTDAVSAHAWGFWDFLPTAADIAGVASPKGLDGVSVLPTLLGKKQKPEEFMYWEFHERGTSQAVRMGKWKAIRKGSPEAPIELYDLSNDIGETRNVAKRHPEIVVEIAKYLATARTESEHWPLRVRKTTEKKKQAQRRQATPERTLTARQ